MKEQPVYKSVKVFLSTWVRLTQLSALTHEPRTKLLDRLVRDALTNAQTSAPTKEEQP